MKIEPSQKLKTNKRYIWYGVYAALANISFAALVVFLFLSDFIHITFLKDDVYLFFFIFGLMVFIMPAFVMAISSTMPVPNKYGLFGRYERTKPPNDVPESEFYWGSSLDTVFVTPFTITNQYASARKWSFYQEGIAIQFYIVGTVFIPYEYISEVRSGFARGYLLVHSWSEAFSPIGIPKKVFEELSRKIGKND